MGSKCVRACVALLGLMLGACGGGGGGGGGGGMVPVAGSAGANYAADLSIRINSPRTVDKTVYEGQQIPNVAVSGTLSGNVNALAGKVLYLVLVMPEPLFLEKPLVSVNASALAAVVTMVGATAPEGAKVHQGNITLKACLDAACQTQIRVENPDIPYSITVNGGLKLARDDVDFVTPFGTPAAAETVAVTLPTQVASWSVRPLSGGTKSFDVAKAPDDPPRIVVSPAGLMNSGSFVQASYSVEAITSDGQRLTRTLDASLRTQASNVPYVLYKPDAHFVVKQGTANSAQPEDNYVYFPGNTSDKMSYVGTTLTTPAGVDTSMYPAANLWLYFHSSNEAGLPKRPTRQDSWETTVQACYGGRCLPAGRYSALVHFRYSPDGGPVYDIDYPVVMDIVQ